MTCQITINPALVNQTNYICRWHIEHTRNNIVESGKIETEEYSHDHISSIAEKIIELPNFTTKPKRKDIELKFDVTTIENEERAISTVDLFKLYGLLSMKLKPLTINMTR